MLLSCVSSFLLSSGLYILILLLFTITFVSSLSPLLSPPFQLSLSLSHTHTSLDFLFYIVLPVPLFSLSSLVSHDPLFSDCTLRHRSMPSRNLSVDDLAEHLQDGVRRRKTASHHLPHSLTRSMLQPSIHQLLPHNSDPAAVTVRLPPRSDSWCIHS
ncbi:unnamed protein product [Protopolystoma xenopodis]|uniref:Uncharacterized protein n=1 Tax=Protopolystoma xenopodis TaxID=117903 RepID=A0A3S5CC04_9PLAT|nr:unnamed protein product [Protopolystoma xenopodis]